MTPTRRRMEDPSTLEDILILKFNTDMWSSQTIQQIIQEEKEEIGLHTPGSTSTLATPVAALLADDDVEQEDEEEEEN